MRSLFSFYSIIVGLLLLIPLLITVFLGLYFLWQQGWLYYGIGVISANVALFVVLTTWRSHHKKPLIVKPIDISPNPNWSDEALNAWAELEDFAKNYSVKTDLLTNRDKALKLTNDVLLLVASHFNSESKYPVLEFPLPYLLKLISLVCEDLQRDV